MIGQNIGNNANLVDLADNQPIINITIMPNTQCVIKKSKYLNEGVKINGIEINQEMISRVNPNQGVIIKTDMQANIS